MVSKGNYDAMRLSTSIISALLLLGVAASGVAEDVAEAEAVIIEDAEAPGPPPEGGEEGEGERWWSRLSLVPEYHEGLVFKSIDGKLTLRLGTYVLLDAGDTYLDRSLKSQFGEQDASADFRALRLMLTLNLFDDAYVKAEYGFESGRSEVKDFFVQSAEPYKYGYLRFGHFKEPFSLERATSQRNLTFMERSLHAELTPDHNFGIAVFNSEFDGRMTWAAGFFAETNTIDSLTDSGSGAFTFRITGLPWYRDEGRKLFQLGLSFSERRPDDELRFQPRPESYLAPRFLDTGYIDADDLVILNLEAAYVNGPFSAQGEFIQTWLNNASQGSAVTIDKGRLSYTLEQSGDVTFMAWYIQASYFLTGEYRIYDRALGRFVSLDPYERLEPKTPGAVGAFQVAARISHIDLDDNFIRGGRETNFTVGANWHLSQNVRFMMNFIHAEVDHDDYDGSANIIQGRFQISFQQRSLGEIMSQDLSWDNLRGLGW